MAKETFDRLKPYIGAVTPPAQNLANPVITLTAGVLTTATISFNGGDSAGFYWLIKMAAPTAAGRTTVSESSLKYIYNAENSGLAGLIDFSTELQARFGDPPLGSTIHFIVQQVDSVSGQRWDMAK